MRLWILSDLHISLRQARAGSMDPRDIPAADVAVDAGDACESAIDSVGFLARTIALRMPVVMTLGNHEHYGGDHGRTRLEAVHVAAAVSDLHLLDDSEAIVDGVASSSERSGRTMRSTRAANRRGSGRR